MARYASPHQLALSEEIVPLDGPDLVDGDGPDGAKQVKEATAAPGLAVIEPVIGAPREVPASRQPASAPVADGDTHATETESEDDVEPDSSELAGECGDEPEEPWVATVDDSDSAPATGAPASTGPGPSSTRLAARALAIGVLVLVAVGVAVVAVSNRVAQRAASTDRASTVPVAGRPVPLFAPHRKRSTRRAHRPQRRRYHRRRRHHEGRHRRHRRHHAGGARSRSAAPAPAVASAPSPAPAAPPPSAARPGGGTPTGGSSGSSGSSSSGSSGGSSENGGGGSSTGGGASSDPTFEAGF